ncbi:division/cell wall cluster transcriptional repressor MraZ [Candidatus Dojkabacteria bacterium]|nr:division/cell wall cluster transcriptional repressor MraZ [Candidatus Dojkabacteria bacterium]
MIIGQYSSKIGEKKRVALPKKFRDQFKGNLILTRGYENCLVLVDEKQWSEITKDVINGQFIDKKIRDTSRFLIAGAHEIELDLQGRFVVPDGLVEYADLKEEAIFLGLVNWVEVWSKSKWTEHEKYISENGEKIAQELITVSKNISQK